MTARTRWAALAIAGALLFAAGLAGNPSRAWIAYLTAYVAVLTVALGALCMIMAAHLTDAVWFVVLRRSAEAVSDALPLLAVLAIPLGFGLQHLYPWTHPDALDASVRELVERKLAYLNAPFFLVRAVVCLVCWSAFAVVFRRWSQGQDAGDRMNPPFRALSAAGAILVGITMTVAAIDWIMSLTPEWSSTIFGVQLWAGAMVSALALVAAWSLPDREATTAVVRPVHANALASLLQAFVIFWIYVGFCQLLVIWIGNEPREIVWYVPRLQGRWALLGIILIVGHFLVPFLLLLQRSVKYSRPRLAKLGIWLLVMHYADVFWVIGPQAHGELLGPHWLDAAALAFVIGITGTFATWRWQRSPAVPLNDPALPLSIAYEEP